MTRSNSAIAIAVIVYVLAWFLPVLKSGEHGWVAFRVALSPIWQYDGLQTDSGPGTFLLVASGLSNVLFIVLAGLLWRWPARFARVAMWSLVVATLLNTHWFVLSSASDRGDLREGYYLWVGAFLLLAFGAYLHRPKASADRP